MSENPQGLATHTVHFPFTVLASIIPLPYVRCVLMFFESHILFSLKGFTAEYKHHTQKSGSVAAGTRDLGCIWDCSNFNVEF